MVKNTQGGCKHKGMARKLVNAPISAKPRLSESDDECYAFVTKMLGNGMCHVNLSHNGSLFQNVVGHIRGKFRGRNKKNNLVSTGNFVLVGIRTWENTIKNCDIIFTFIDSHIQYIPFDIISIISQQNSFSSLDNLLNYNTTLSIHHTVTQTHTDTDTDTDTHVDVDII